MYSPTDQLESYLLKNRGALLGFIRSKVGDEDLAEDILQDSLLKALQAAPGLEDEDKLVSWFYRIIRNAITDAYRRHAAAARRLEQYALEQPDSTLPISDEAALCACFEGLLPTLKPEYAELIEAMDLGGATAEEMEFTCSIDSVDQEPGCAAQGLATECGNLRRKPGRRSRSR